MRWIYMLNKNRPISMMQDSIYAAAIVNFTWWMVEFDFYEK